MHASLLRHVSANGNLRRAARIVAACAAAVGALALLANVEAAAVHVGADAALVASLLTLAHTVFRLVDDLHDAPGDDRNRPPGA